MIKPTVYNEKPLSIHAHRIVQVSKIPKISGGYHQIFMFENSDEFYSSDNIKSRINVEVGDYVILEDFSWRVVAKIDFENKYEV